MSLLVLVKHLRRPVWAGNNPRAHIGSLSFLFSSPQKTNESPKSAPVAQQIRRDNAKRFLRAPLPTRGMRDEEKHRDYRKKDYGQFPGVPASFPHAAHTSSSRASSPPSFLGYRRQSAATPSAAGNKSSVASAKSEGDFSLVANESCGTLRNFLPGVVARKDSSDVLQVAAKPRKAQFTASRQDEERKGKGCQSKAAGKRKSFNGVNRGAVRRRTQSRGVHIRCSG